MGGSSSQTVGYWYRWAMLFGWCKGPVDAFLEFRAGGLTAWAGRLTESGRLTINMPDLWGGEDTSGQGGLVGALDVMFGEATQEPNDYMLATFGERQSARRGKLCTCWRGGKFGAYVSNPKPVSAKVERILTDWQDGAVWYPEKARINLSTGSVLPRNADGWEYLIKGPEIDPGNTFLDPPSSGWAPCRGPFGTSADFPDVVNTEWPLDTVLWARRTVTTPNSGAQILRVQAENGCVIFVDGNLVGAVNQDNVPIPGNQGNVFEFTLSAGQTFDIVVKAYDETDGTAPLGGTYCEITVFAPGFNAMNPAHMIYDSITHQDMQGEPAGIISDASFRAAADKLYAEQFGLCTDYDSSAETPQQFQQRICNVIGASLSQSRVDGLYYLDLIRGDYELESLPVIGEDDIISFSQDPSVITETGNRLQVEWFDPQAKEVRTTAPVFAMGNVRSAGRVIAADTKQYHEVPSEPLALRCAVRDLKSTAMPLNRLNLTTRATMRRLRPGMNARLQLPSEGIGDMVVVVGSVQHGTQTDGQMKIVAVENVFSMPDTTYVQPQDGSWTAPSNTPTVPPAQRAIEAPYIELVAALSDGDLAALPADAGYLATLAVRAKNGPNYRIASAAEGEEYETHDIADWCPSVVVNEAAGYADTTFTFTSGTDLDRVSLGMWALWDDEIVRVDALDAEARTLSLGRGCADTVPRQHDAASRILFAGEWTGSDSRAYVGGETVRAKLLTRTRTQTLPLEVAPELEVEMVDRANRPYPPGKLLVDGVTYPETLDGALQLTWAHRDRLLQADQLIDTSAGNVGPEAGTAYRLRLYNELDGLVRTVDLPGTSYQWLESDERADSGLSGDATLWTPLLLAAPPRILLNDLSPAVADGSNGCSSLGDLSGHGFTFSQATAGLRPIIVPGGLNSRRVLSFDGTRRLIGGASTGGMRNTTGGFIFGVYKLSPADASNAYRSILEIDTPSSTFVRMGLFAGTSAAKNRAAIGGRRLDGDNLVLATSATERSATWVLALGVLDYAARTVTLYINGTQDIQVTGAWSGAGASSDTASTAVTFGSDSAGTSHAFRGQIAEVVVGDGGPISTDEINQLFGYAAWRWGLQGNLPSGHPYKAAPPLDGASGQRVNGRIRFELEARRDGVTSLQHHDVEVRRAGYGFNYDMYYGGS